MIRISLALLMFLFIVPAHAERDSPSPMVIRIPYMEREAAHRIYADDLLRLVLESSRDKYGSYKIVQQRRETVIRRQLLEVESGRNLSLAVSMPTPEWLEKTRIVQFPIMRGLPSYRLFLASDKNRGLFEKVNTLSELTNFSIGQGQGWSTAKILEDNGFKLVYGGPYPTLIPMLKANRFELLMRSIYEVEPELKAYKTIMPELMVVENFGLFTYLPMYFFVSKNQPLLAERLEYGLHKAHNTGELDRLFDKHFSEALVLLRNKKRKTFFLSNTNIDQGFFDKDQPYLLKEIIRLELQNRKK